MAPKHLLLSCVSVLAFTTVVSAHAATVIVLKSTDDALQTGMQLDGNAELTLPTGSNITFLTESGKLIKLKGPWKGVIAGGSDNTAKTGVFGAVSALVTREKDDLRSLGAVRDTANQKLRDPWTLNVTENGAFCIKDTSAAPVLYRPDADNDVKLTLARKDGPAFAVNWSAKSTVKNWPQSKIPLVDGSQYAVALDKQVQLFRFHVAENAQMTEEETLSWLMQKGCSDQVIRFIASL